VWVAPPRNEVFRIVLGAIERHGKLDVALPPGPPFFRYSDAAVVKQSLAQAGLGAVQIGEVPGLWRFDRAAELVDAMIKGTVRTGALLRAQTPEALERIRIAIAEGAAAFAGEEGIAIPMPSVLLSARKG
jgi:hypothetical protein